MTCPDRLVGRLDATAGKLLVWYASPGQEVRAYREPEHTLIHGTEFVSWYETTHAR